MSTLCVCCDIEATHLDSSGMPRCEDHRAGSLDTAPAQSPEMLALRVENTRLRKELATATKDLNTWRGMCLNAREALRRPDLAQAEDEEGCPVGDPDCLSRNNECHTACEAPKTREDDDGC